MKMLMLSDAELVRESLGGQTEAFAMIVDRYKALVSGVTYSFCGSLSESEEMAQEVFIAAWKELRSLREPEKLKSWLCGIARNISASKVRRHVWRGKEVPLDSIEERPAHDPTPPDATISREEESLMWRALEQMPETYREPLILYYREQCSVQGVAEALELSIDAAKQRLSRGRKMLQDEIAKVVESTLQRSIPGRAFTFGVLGALPMLSSSAAAATVAGSAAKGSTVASSATIIAWIGMIAGPLVGILAAWLGVKESLKNAQSEAERRTIVRWTKWMVGLVLGSILVISGSTWLAVRLMPHSTALAVALLAGMPLIYVLLLFGGIIRCNRELRQVRLAVTPAASASVAASKVYEWRSKAHFLGLPLVHFKSGHVPGAKRRPAMGWVAIGDLAVGVLFAAGGVAVGAISMGGAAIGLLSLGGAVFGVVAMGGLSVGWMPVGGLALGYFAVGGVAIGWKAAVGGLAVASEFALGGAAVAAHANDRAAQEAIQQMPLVVRALGWLKQWQTFSFLIWCPVLLVVARALWTTRKKRVVERKIG
jgi:RNA polymerase sigma factor (sigma-70 family)